MLSLHGIKIEENDEEALSRCFITADQVILENCHIISGEKLINEIKQSDSKVCLDKTSILTVIGSLFLLILQSH